MRAILDSKMVKIQELLLKMSASVEEILEKSIKSLVEQDLELAQEVIELDKRIDELEEKIEKKCINVIATQQPLASDLRKLSAILKIITDLERIGDHAVNIAEVVLDIGDEKLIKPLIDIPKMASITRSMISKSLDAYINDDDQLAKEVAKMDDEVDDLYEGIYHELLDMYSEDKTITKQLTQLLFIGRYLERIADHTTNICERIIYMVTGKREHY